MERKDLRFAVVQDDRQPLRDRLAAEIVECCRRHGHRPAKPELGVQFVINLTSAEKPQFFRRRAQSIFVFSLVTLEKPPADAAALRKLCYTTLVLTLSNILLCVVPRDAGIPFAAEGNQEIYLTTPEGGFYHYPFVAEHVYDSIIPIAGAHYAIGNVFTNDLPPEYWRASPVLEKMIEYSGELGRLGVLPTPFPLSEVLPPELFEHLYSLFEMKGLSFGNLSARESISELGDTTFWMTARGVDKARIGAVGRDVLLITGFDHERGQARVSVPPDYDPRARVSVDAVEHEMIYRRYPRVGAIVHVHAWMDGLVCTRQNFPCGTRELAEEVCALLALTDDPPRAAVGLKNHGLTITGPDLGDIFQRLRGKLLVEVPMFA
jgi:ribulose-5-phosphate 4-epimerase/fuculose-1-phosphate aldolase